MGAQQIIDWLRGRVNAAAHLCLDSRQIGAGDVFFACPGLAGDGRLYIEDALARGAAAVVAEAGPVPAGAQVLQVEGLRGLLGAVGHGWYGEPSSHMSVLAVTGTNGKTTTVQWLAAALNQEGVPCGTVGTLGVTLPDGTNLGGALTTPDVLTMHRSLAAIRAAGGKAAALEASSIGLEQGRLEQVRIEIAGFTNLTRDHLDYHGSLENYRAAKFALFDWPGLRAAVVNLDDEAGRQLYVTAPVARCVGYTLGHEPDAGLQAQDIQAGTYGLIFNLVTAQGTAQIVTRLVGEHNVSNLLLVAGALRELGWTLARIARALAALRPVEGRLQIVEPAVAGEGAAALPMVVVDYAHTPDALERALLALRQVAQARGGRLVCVFGCGGGRDSGKRPMMGEIASRLADAAVVTSDNPRSEDPSDIAAQVVAGMRGTPTVELDRALAILGAVWSAQPGDVVLVAGKGHETYQETAGRRTLFDDREWAGFALSWGHGLAVSTDTRSLRPGELFIALKGESFDGHEYLERARQAGACAAVVAQRDPTVGLHQFELGNTRAALARIGAAWRRRFSLPVIAVTGSNGKTTTKEMVASVLRAWLHDDALATSGNLNNDIGVPLTLLRLRATHRAAVFELGMNHPGEIAILAEMARPTVALVNNAQREHQEFMHSVEAVALENGAVLQSLPDDGVAVFPGDDAYTDTWRRLAGARLLRVFGFDPGFDVHADDIHAESRGTRCQLHTPAGVRALALRAPGLHNLRNALAAAACACAAGAPLDAVVSGLEQFNPVAGRMQPSVLPGGLQLIDDTYNANPDSVRAAIDVLAQLPGRRMLVLGDMAEVGANGPAMHAEVGAYARERGIEQLLTFGPAARNSADAFGAGAQAYDSIDALVAGLRSCAPAHILVKGSRSTRMERVVQAIRQQSDAQEQEARHAT